MKFFDALVGVIHKSGWIAESVKESPREIDLKVVEYNNRRNSGQIRVRMDLVKESWDNLPEEKQVLGKEKLEKSLQRVFQQFAQMPYMAADLDPSYWTP